MKIGKLSDNRGYALHGLDEKQAIFFVEMMQKEAKELKEKIDLLTYASSALQRFITTKCSI